MYGVLVETLFAMTALLLIGLIPIWAERRHRHAAERRAADHEPCWTEEMESDDKFRYARSYCFDEGLHEMDARARAGEFNTPC